MSALNYLAMVILAVLFIGMGFAIYSNYQRGALEKEFETKAELLANRVNLIGTQNEGSRDYLEIYVPSNCQLSFSDNAVLVRIGGSSRSFPVSVPVEGPVFSNQRVNLVIQRTAAGVSLSAT